MTSFLKIPKPDEEYDILTRQESLRSTDDEAIRNSAFLLSMEKRQYGEQYSNIYFARLVKKRPKVYSQGKRAWDGMKIDGNDVKYSLKVLDTGSNKVSWVVGTVYREMKFKPSILEEITASHFGAPPPPPEKYTDPDSDEIMLEDESGRIKLVGKAISDESRCLVTGCVIAVLGTELPSGDFEVLDVRFSEYAPQKPIPLPNPEKSRPRYLALVSGLSIKGSAYEEYTLQILKEFLTGELGGVEDQEESSNIVQVIMAGNSLDADDEENSGKGNVGLDGSSTFSSAFLPNAAQLAEAVSKRKTKVVKYGYDRSQFHPEPMQHLDTFIADIASSVPVSIMPGVSDIANVTLPQQPIHPALFPESRKLAKSSSGPIFESVTNPHWWELATDSQFPVTIFGSSGQPINDMYKYLPGEDIDRLDLLNQTLRWQHAAPTAPDTLSAYPFYDKDPFLLSETPHIYFAGNQPYFDTRVVQGPDEKGNPVTVRLVSIPDFGESGELVLVNLNSDTFETTSIKFG